MTGNGLKVKICGIKDTPTAELIVDLGASFIGFVCYDKSPRNISLTEYKAISDILGERVKTIIVTVAPSDEFLEAMLKLGAPDYLQIHGKIDTRRLNFIKSKYRLKLITAISHQELKQELIDDLESLSEHVLIDSASQVEASGYGGSGLIFDWEKLAKFKFTKPYFLSGGLNISNIKEAIELTRVSYVDLSSGLEEVRGVKSRDKIIEFFNYLRANEIL
ncbi:MAG: phosphoribosylanthranilate isomerase [Rickettsiales bacterium]|jgi:phosphoribosylanthranilate isomerase|nr:phosphoribosylanthranilate isomerase [Rickettsiales bacterium]